MSGEQHGRDDSANRLSTKGGSRSSIRGLLGNLTGFDPASTFSLFTGYSAPISITAGDLDADGDIDLAYVAEDSSGSRVSLVVRNTLAQSGSLGWVLDANEDLVGNEPYLVRSADVDGDGDDDVVALIASSTPFSGDGDPPPPGFASTQMLANSPQDCVGDFNEDGAVDGQDLARVLGSWGTDDPDVELSGDNLIDGTDLAIILGSWGACNDGQALD